MTTPITDIARFLKTEDTTEIVTIKSRRSIRLSLRTLDYYIGITDSGESVAVCVSPRSLLFNCLNLPRLRHTPRLRLTGCSGHAKRTQPSLPSWLGPRIIYCEDAQFADSMRALAFEIARESKEYSVGARMDAILAGEFLPERLESESAIGAA